MKAGPFKQYQRGQRVQTSEEKLNLGMQYTNIPLTEGYAKKIVNFNLKDRGEIAVPRAGLRAKELALFPKQILSNSEVYPYSEDMMLAGGRDCVEFDNKHFKQIILGNPSNTKLEGTNLYKGQLYTGTIYDKGVSFEDPQYVPVELEGVETNEMHLDPIAHDLANYWAVFKKPTQAEIHGLELTDLNYIAQQIGTFAFNNSYYCFRHRSNNTAALFYTRLMEDARAKHYCYRASAVEPRALTPKEAVIWGYNMLLENPYMFSNSNAAGSIQFLGLLPYDANNDLQMSPQVNQTVTLKCFYAVNSGDKYTIDWEWKEPAASNWVKFKTEDRTFSNLNDLQATFSSPLPNVMVRISATKWEGSTKDSVVSQILTVGFNFKKEAYGSTANVKPVKYSLHTCSGMTYWKNRLVVWSPKEDATLMFMSEVNDPSYFPYPNNAEVFDEPVIHAMPFLDDLIVFTASKLYLIKLNPDGLSWTKKLIQGNLNIKEWDIHLIKAVKNMVFFRSGNYYYMVVPKANANGELTIAPISKQIMGLLDNFKASIDNTIQLLYDYSDSLELVHYYNFLDFEDVYNMYVFKTPYNLYINVALLYNIAERNWRIHIYESQHILVPFQQDATKKGTLMGLVPIFQAYKKSTVETVYCPSVQFLQFNDLEPKDFYVPNNLVIFPSIDGSAETISNIQEKYAEVHYFGNYQLLDTGYREQSSDYNKRYREVQFKINNVGQKSLNFSHEIMIDGDVRHTFYKYEARHVIDPADPRYGTLYMERVTTEPVMVPGVTILAEDQNDTTAWQLDVSMFPEATFWKVRIPFSGKGYAPRIRLLSFNENMYELLNISWVFRPLYSR